MTTTIKVSKSTRDRLHKLAEQDGLTLGQEIEKLIEQSGRRPKPTIGGFRSGGSLTAEEIDEELARGFGRW